MKTSTNMRRSKTPPEKKQIVKTTTMTAISEPEVHVRLRAAKDRLDNTMSANDDLLWKHTEIDGLLDAFDMWAAKSEIGTFRVTKNAEGHSIYLNAKALARGFYDLGAAQGYCESHRKGVSERA